MQMNSAMLSCLTAALVRQDPRPRLPGLLALFSTRGCPCSALHSFHTSRSHFFIRTNVLSNSLIVLTFQPEHGSFACQLTPWLKLKAPLFVFFPHVLSSLIFFLFSVCIEFSYSMFILSDPASYKSWYFPW